MKKLLSKHIPFCATVCLLLACLTVFVLTPAFRIWHASHAFDTLCQTIFQEEMRADTLNMHYTVARPENYGLFSYTPVLAGFNDQSQSTPADYLSALEKIDKTRLSDTQCYLYESLKRQLETQNRLWGYPCYAEPCSMNGGVLTNLVILLSEYRFYRETDVQDYLQLLEQTDAYLRSLGEYERTRESMGLTYARSVYQNAAQICDTLALLAPDILKESFSKRLSELSLKESRQDAYCQKHDTLVQEILVPAYQSLAKIIRPLGQDTTLPLCALPDGKQYYTDLFHYKTGVYESFRTVSEWLKQELSGSYYALQKILSGYDASQQHELLQGDFALPNDMSEETALELLAASMKENYPALSQTVAQVKTVWPGMEVMTAPAFYLSTPIDKYDTGVIYINPSSTCSPLERFTTLAHEGYPGHMYQDIYQNQNRSRNESMVYALLGSTGYHEGWALYSEFEAYYSLARYYKEKGNDLNCDKIRLEVLYRKLQLAVFAYMDIAIHYQGLTLTELTKQLSFLGLSSKGMEKMYQFILENPCYYPSYYVGYLGLKDLQSAMKETRKEEYSARAFHEFYLKYGPNDFSSMKNLLLKR